MMNLNNFFQSLSDDQKKNLAEALLNSIDNKSENNDPPEDNTISNIKEEPVKPKDKASQKPKITVDDNFVVKKNDFSDNQNRRKEPVKARKNEWHDNGEFRDLDSSDYQKTPSPRRREPPKKIDVDCHVCGRSFKVDQRFVYGEYYRCNKCVGK